MPTFAFWLPPVGLFSTALAVVGAIVSLMALKGWKRIASFAIFILLGTGEWVAIIKADNAQKTWQGDITAKLERIINNSSSRERQQQATELKREVANPPSHLRTSWSLSLNQKTNLRTTLANKCSLIVGTRFDFRFQNPPLTILLQDKNNADAYRLGRDLQDEFRSSGCGNVNLEDATPFRGSGITEEPFFGVKIFSGYTPATKRVATSIGRALNVPTNSRMGQEPQDGHYEGIIILIGSRPNLN